MGMGHVPQDPLRPEGSGADVQRRQRGGTPAGRDVDRARQQRGRWGEDQAARWYRQHGYEIIDRNWRVAIGELDLVVQRGPLLVFAEVKTRATDAFGAPELAVTFAKQRRLRRLASAWLAAHDLHPRELRFDVVAVLGVRVNVVEAAF